MKSGSNSQQNKKSSLGEIGLTSFAPYLMNRIIGRYNANLRGEMKALSLTTAKMRSIAVLMVLDGIQIGELAVYAVVEQSTLSRALDQLENNGLVHRRTDQADSRATRIFITDKGREAFEKMWPHISDAYEQMFEGVSTEERMAFVATLQKMLGNIRQHDF